LQLTSDLRIAHGFATRFYLTRLQLNLGVRQIHTLVSTPLVVPCGQCGHANTFPQPYPYHAGFGDTVFLYNDAGNCTLAWGTYDLAYEAMVGRGDPWQPTPARQAALEARLPVSPKGDRWRFANPARCAACGHPLRQPMITGERYYLEYPDSIILGRAGLPSHLEDYLKSRPSA
jgi:hypothetical protein